MKIEFLDGAILTPVPTAHHTGVSSLEQITSTTANLNEKDQRRVRVPFHFLPGGEGEDYTQRLVCAAEYHRAYVLRDLMPRHGMVIC